MHTSADYTVSVDVAQRAGLYGYRYMTSDGRVILSEADLRRVRLKPEEYVTGIDAVLVETEEELRQLIHDGGYRMLPDGEAVTPEGQQEEETPEENGAPAEEQDPSAGEDAGNGSESDNGTVTNEEEEQDDAEQQDNQ